MQPRLLRTRDGSDFIIDPPSPKTYDMLPVFTEAVELAKATDLHVFIRVPANIRASIGRNSKPNDLNEKWRELRDSGRHMLYGKLLRDYERNQEFRQVALRRLPAIEVVDTGAWRQHKAQTSRGPFEEAVDLAERWARYMQHALKGGAKFDEIYFPSLYWADGINEMGRQRKRVLDVLNNHWKHQQYAQRLINKKLV